MKTITYKITRYSDKISKDELEQGIKQGLRLWEKETDLRFKQVEHNQYLTIEFRKDVPMFSNGTITAFKHTLSESIIFNDRFYWSLDGKPIEIRNEFGQLIKVKTQNLPAITAHEFGHVAGLLHTDNKEDLMYYPCEIVTNPSENDIQRIKRLIAVC